MAKTCASSNLRRIARLVTRHYDRYLEPTGVTATQLPILAAIGAEMGESISHLAEILGIERSTLSRDLNVLRRKGLVESRPGADERVQRLATTAKGSHVLHEAHKAWERAHTELMDVASDLPKNIRDLRKLESSIAHLPSFDVDD